MSEVVFERRVDVHPAWDKRNEDPKKNYGVHGVEMRWVLIGPKGATQFLLYTGWYLPETVGVQTDGRMWDHDYGKALASDGHSYPMPADLGYHAYEPLYEGHLRMDSCDVLNQPCYYDGSGLNAQRPFLRLLREGSDGVWAELQDYYESLFTEKASG